MTAVLLRRHYLWALTFMLLLSFTSLQAKQATIEIVTEVDWPETTTISNKKGSLSIQISAAVLERMGYNVNITFTPWARALRMAVNGTVDGVAGIYFTEQRAETLTFTNPVTTSELTLYKRRDRNIAYTGDLTELSSYTIGVVRTYTYGESFDNANYLNRVVATKPSNNLNMLLAKRLDLIVESNKTIEFLLRETYPNNIDDIVALKPIIKKQEVHFAFSKKLPNHEALTQRFNQVLAELIEDGSIQKLEAQFAR